MINNTAPDVKQLLKEGRNPILPFERDMLVAELEKLGIEQTDLGRLLAEAMDQSSETWHDNAPADAVNNQARLLTQRAEGLIRNLGSALLLNYPDPSDGIATIGSIVQVRYPGESNTDGLFVT